jgi:hypothetical protein
VATDNKVATACMQVRVAAGVITSAETEAKHVAGCDDRVADARRALEDAILAAAPLIEAQRASGPVTA